jgi:hypothetical protein
MNRTTGRVAIAAGLAVCGLALVACSTPAAGPATTPTTTGTTAPERLSPSDALASALDKLTGASYDYSTNLVDRNSTTTLSGSVDGRTGARVTIDGNEAGTVIHQEVILINGDAWFKLDFSTFNARFGIDPTKWMKADLSKLPHFTGPPDLTGKDVLDTHSLFTVLGDVTETDSTHLSGTFDLTAATGFDRSDPATVAAAGPAAKTAPFTATVDDQGRLTQVTYTVPGTKISFQMQCSHYGSPSAITPPDPATVIPMPAKVYSAITS